MPGSATLDRFMSATFRSVWALEVLLCLRREASTSHSRQGLIELLRASDAVVSKSIESLLAAGLIVEDDDGLVRYSPVSSDLEERVGEVELLYRARPDAVRRVIVASSTGSLAAFANAFKLKGD
jgi:hypothetical protein